MSRRDNEREVLHKLATALNVVLLRVNAELGFDKAARRLIDEAIRFDDMVEELNFDLPNYCAKVEEILDKYQDCTVDDGLKSLGYLYTLEDLDVLVQEKKKDLREYRKKHTKVTFIRNGRPITKEDLIEEIGKHEYHYS